MSYFKILDLITKKSFSPIYLLYGNEPYFMNQICNAIQENAIEEANRMFDQKTLYAEKDIDINSLICDLKSYPMIGHTQLVIIKNFENFKKIEKLESYFSTPQISTILVLYLNIESLSSIKSMTNKKWVKLIKEKFVVFESKKLFPNQVSGWLANYIIKKGYKSTAKVNAMLAEFLGNDLGKISNEIDKLLLVLKEKKITEFDVEKYVGISRDYNVFELQNSLAQKNYEKSLRILNYLIENNQPIVLIIASLYSFFSKILIFHSLRNNTKIVISSKLKINPYFFPVYNLAKTNYSFDKCIQIIGSLKKSDLSEKGIPIDGRDNPNFLKELIFRIIHG